jgi:hypothetical protein
MRKGWAAVDVVDGVDVGDAVGSMMAGAAAGVAGAASIDGWGDLDFDGLSASERIEALVACERLARRAQALVVRALGVLDQAQQRERGVERGCTEAEVCAALRWAPNTAQTRLAEAGMLTSRLPETLDALSNGMIAWAQARALVEATASLEDETARAVQARVLGRMAGQSVAATRKAVRRAVVAADPDGADRRHACERARRRLVWCPEADGMATVSLYTTAQIGAAFMAAVDRRARVCGPGDARTMDQRRADALAALVLSGSGVRFSGTQDAEMEPHVVVPGASSEAVVRFSGTAEAAPSPTPAALVQVMVGIDTLLGTDEEPGELRGYGPITAREARELAFASGSTWRRLLTAPDGTLLHADPHAYRPAAAVARLVRLRDRQCVFPGCAMPAARCDLDHARPFDRQVPAAGGATVPQNLQALCRRHHRLKTAGLWSVERDAATDSARWTSPSGHSYTTRPEPYLSAA